MTQKMINMSDHPTINVIVGTVLPTDVVQPIAARNDK
jgi:hypothetical protein